MKASGFEKCSSRMPRLGAALAIILACIQPAPLLALDEKTKTSAQISNNPETLPALVRKMRNELYRATRSGDLQTLREVMELNELPPTTGKLGVRDPIVYWKKISSDGQGTEIVARMSLMLELGFAHVKAGTSDEMFIWPYLAVLDLKTLKPHQKIDLHRLMGTKQAIALIERGRFKGFTLGIGPDGTWHYFMTVR